MRRIACLAAACAAACTDTGPGPNPVTVTVVGEPAMIAYRNFEGPWLVPDAGAQPGDYVLHVTDAYRLALTCSDATGFDTVVRSATFGDADTMFVYCDGHSTALDGSAHVTGDMLQAGTVSMYDFQQSTSAPWSFQLAVPPGTRDLVAYGNGKALIRRDLAITDGVALAPIDVDRDGSALEPVALALDGVQPGDSLTTELDLYGANNLAFGPTVEGATAQALPAALLRPTDQLDLFITATSQDGRFTRTVDTWFTGTETRFQLMPTLDGASIAGATATWSALPPHTAVALELVAGTQTTWSAERIFATQAWLDETGTTELALPADMPERFQQAWTIDPGAPHTASFSARDDSTSIAYETKLAVSAP